MRGYAFKKASRVLINKDGQNYDYMVTQLVQLNILNSDNILTFGR